MCDNDDCAGCPACDADRWRRFESPWTRIANEHIPRYARQWRDIKRSRYEPCGFVECDSCAVKPSAGLCRGCATNRDRMLSLWSKHVTVSNVERWKRRRPQVERRGMPALAFAVDEPLDDLPWLKAV